jgi:hypothetical protein
MEPQAAVAARRIAAARKPKPVDILQRPVPKNPKYDYVTSTLDTGVHANNRPEKSASRSRCVVAGSARSRGAPRSRYEPRGVQTHSTRRA